MITEAEWCFLRGDCVHSSDVVILRRALTMILAEVEPQLRKIEALERQRDIDREMNRKAYDDLGLQYGTERLALIDRAEIDRANLEIKLKELADERRRHAVTQAALDKFISATAELTIERMQLKHQLADLVGEENVK